MAASGTDHDRGTSTSSLPWTGPFTLPTTDRLESQLSPDISAKQIAQDWLTDFASELSSTSPDVTRFFVNDGFWRDLYSLSWDFTIKQGNLSIAEHVLDRSPVSHFRPTVLIEDAMRAPALVSPFPDISFLQFSFRFDTAIGNGSATCRLVNVAGVWKAYTLFTALDALNDFPERVGLLRADSPWHGDWTRKRQQEIELRDGDPSVVIIGAGHSGLALAARLRALGVFCLLLEKNSRIGDNWRYRYKTLSLHDPVWYDQLPYMPYPSTWPVYTPAAKLGDWLEGYANALDLNVWTSSALENATWDPSTRKWTMRVRRGHESREMRVPHLVFATGLGGGVPIVPSIANEAEFEGHTLHSAQFMGAEAFLDKKVVVIGAANSALDIAQDFANHGSDVTLFQRSPTFVVSARTFNTMLGRLFYEGCDVETSDHLSASIPLPVNRQFHQRVFPRLAATSEKPMLEALANAGFETYLGPGDAGLIPLFFGRGGGYYLDTGACEEIIKGNIKVRSASGIETFTRRGLRLSDGSELDADVVIYATGYGDSRQIVKKTCGEAVHSQLKPVWGIERDGEIGSVWRGSGHDGLWFAFGNLSMARYYSKFLALRLKADLEGVR